METVRVKMNAGDLKGIIDLPNYPDNQRVEITVSPSTNKKNFTEKDFDDLLKEIKTFWAKHKKEDELKTYDDYRMERLEDKYGSFN